MSNMNILLEQEECSYNYQTNMYRNQKQLQVLIYCERLSVGESQIIKQ